MILSNLLLMTCFVVGDGPPTIELVPGSKTEVKLGRILILRVKTEGKIVKWVKPSNDVDVEPFNDDGKKVIFCTMTKGVHRLIAYTALGDNPSEPFEIIIKAGDGEVVPPGPSPPVPPNPPTPPAPDSPYTTRFQSEFDKVMSADKTRFNC